MLASWPFLAQINEVMAMLRGGTLGEDQAESLGSDFRRMVTELRVVWAIRMSQAFPRHYPASTFREWRGKPKGFYQWFKSFLDSVIDQGRVNEQKKNFLQLLLRNIVNTSLLCDDLVFTVISSTVGIGHRHQGGAPLAPGAASIGRSRDASCTIRRYMIEKGKSIFLNAVPRFGTSLPNSFNHMETPAFS